MKITNLHGSDFENTSRSIKFLQEREINVDKIWQKIFFSLLKMALFISFVIQMRLHKHKTSLQKSIFSNLKGIELLNYWSSKSECQSLAWMGILTPDVCAQQKNLNIQITFRLSIKNDFFQEGRVH